VSARTVTTQAELDAALSEGVSTVYIASPDGVCLTVRDSGSSHVEARDSSHVEAWGSSHVVARDSSHVVARDSSHVEAWDSSHVVARDSSHVVARDSSHVEAWDSSHVEAWGSSHVEAWDSSHVEARPLVAVHLHSARAQVNGGVVIDIASIDQSDPQTWTDMQGCTVTDGRAIVFKAVDDDLRSGYGMTYPIGQTVTAPDWQPTDTCGAGLHFGPTPRHARAYHDSATRYLACSIPLDAAKGITGGGPAKVKAHSCVVLHEVDIDGHRVDTAEAEQVAS
jgi:hypothetical protein